jgi:hypothetical protein
MGPNYTNAGCCTMLCFIQPLALAVKITKEEVLRRLALTLLEILAIFF